MSRWLVVQIISQLATSIERHLTRQGVEHFSPRCRVLKAKNGRMETVIAPLFPGYLFACSPTTSFCNISAILGVVGDDYAPWRSPALDRAVESLRELADKSGFLPTPRALMRRRVISQFESGDEVKIVGGNLCGYVAMFCRSEGERAELLLGTKRVLIREEYLSLLSPKDDEERTSKRKYHRARRSSPRSVPLAATAAA